MKNHQTISLSVVRRFLNHINQCNACTVAAFMLAVMSASVDSLAADQNIVTVGDGWRIVITPREVAIDTQPEETQVEVAEIDPQIVAGKTAAYEDNDEQQSVKELPPTAKKVKGNRKKSKKVEVDNDLPLIVSGWTKHPTYYEIYNSIPFLRSEYMANPSYRHEATMEIMFGKLRPMTIFKNVPPASHAGPRYDFTYPFQRRPRVNYNFYYPRPTVYRAY